MEALIKERLLSIGVCLLFAGLVWVIWLETCHGLPSFDGSMNLQVPSRLAGWGQYATAYSRVHLFDHRIQTGPTVLFPIAFVFSLFGKTVVSAQIISALYLFGLLCLVYLIIKRLTQRLFAVLGVLLVFQVPYLMRFGHKVYGEIPALFFFFLTLMAVNEFENSDDTRQWKWSIAIGFTSGLAVLTKTVMLIVWPAMGCYALWKICFTTQIALRHVFFFMMGVLIALVPFEIYRLAVLGSEDFVVWWLRNLHAVTQQAGLCEGFSDSISMVEKLSVHWRIYLTSFDMGHVEAAFFLLFPILVGMVAFSQGWYKRAYVKKNFGLFVIMLNTSIVYHVWWMMVTPTSKAWARRIINGFIVHEILVTISIWLVVEFCWVRISESESTRRASVFFIKKGLAILLTGGVLFHAVNIHHDIDVKWLDSKDKSDAVYIASAIKALPAKAIICGVGWWQAPVLSFLSGRIFHDIQSLGTLRHGDKKKEIYLAVDAISMVMSGYEISWFLHRFKHTLVAGKGGYALYRLHGPDSAPGEFRPEHKKLPEYMAFMEYLDMQI